MNFVEMNLAIHSKTSDEPLNSSIGGGFFVGGTVEMVIQISGVLLIVTVKKLSS